MSVIKVNNITSRDGTTGPVIAGIATVSTTSHLVVPTGNTGQKVALAPDPYINNLVLALPFNSESVFSDVSPNSKGDPATVGIGTTTLSLPNGISGVSTIAASGIVTFSKYYTHSCFFNGTTAHLQFINDSTMQFGLQDFTFETWFYWRGTRTEFQICGSASDDFNIYVGSGVGFYDGTNTTISTASTTTGTWHHYALTRKYEVGISSSFQYKYRVFIDGNEIGSFGRLKDYSSGISFVVGRNGTGGTTLADGYLQDLRLYKGVAKYTSNFTPPNQIAL